MAFGSIFDNDYCESWMKVGFSLNYQGLHPTFNRDQCIVPLCYHRIVTLGIHRNQTINGHPCMEVSFCAKKISRTFHVKCLLLIKYLAGYYGSYIEICMEAYTLGKDVIYDYRLFTF